VCSISVRSKSLARRMPAPALVATSAVSTQCGAAIATKLFSDVGPSGTATLRLVFAAVTLLAVVRPRRADVRRLAVRRNLLVMVAFGLALAGMNFSFYEALARVPLGVAVTLEFVGPLALAVATSRKWTDALWALLAGTGVFLLASGNLLGTLHRLDVAGVGLSLLAGGFWAGYILTNREAGRRFPGTSGLAGAMAVAAIAVMPFGIVHAGARLLHPAYLAVGLCVAVLSSALPYSCDMAALRRVPPRTFGILLSVAPAIAALTGLAVLDQRLSSAEVGALVLVVAANVGSSWFGARRAHAPDPGEDAEPPLSG
jgi:inner membrane transporter RhtA